MYQLQPHLEEVQFSMIAYAGEVLSGLESFVLVLWGNWDTKARTDLYLVTHVIRVLAQGTHHTKGRRKGEILLISLNPRPHEGGGAARAIIVTESQAKARVSEDDIVSRPSTQSFSTDRDCSVGLWTRNKSARDLLLDLVARTVNTYKPVVFSLMTPSVLSSAIAVNSVKEKLSKNRFPTNVCIHLLFSLSSLCC